MDRNSVIGLILIAVIMVVFSIMNAPSEEEIKMQKAQADSLQRAEDSVANLNKKVVSESKVNGNDSTVTVASNVYQEYLKQDTTKTALTAADSAKVDSIVAAKASAAHKSKYGIFAGAVEGKEEIYTIENDKIRISISSKGGRIISAELKEYTSYQNYKVKRHVPLRLFDKDSSKMTLRFFSNNVKLETSDFHFQPLSNVTKVIADKNKGELKFRLQADAPGKYIEFVYGLNPGEYHIDYKINMVGFEKEGLVESANLIWNMKPLSTEKLLYSERQISSIFYKYFDEKRSYLSEMGNDKIDLELKTNWVAFKTSYFSTVIIADKGIKKDGSSLEVLAMPSDKYIKQYIAELNISNEKTAKASIPLKIYFGPNEYEILKKYDNGMENIINLGWGIFGWVNKYLVIPIFHMLENFNMNYGIIILILTLIVKIIILPLTYRNYKSSAKMRVLKPDIAEINKKFADEPMKKQQATMALYRESGVSPLAGCIPVLIQMPILIAVFRFFPSAIQLRQQNFLWADDLSAYDSIAELGFSIPAYGDHVSLFTILMCASTILFTWMNSGQMDTGQMPGMKFMMYFFPVMMLFFFNSMASGLSYYYFISNMMSILIMILIKKYFIDENKIRHKIAEYKKRPDSKKKSKFQQRIEDMQKQRMNQSKKK